MFQKKPVFSLLGLDIQASMVRCLQLEKVRGTLTIRYAAASPLPHGAMVAGRIVNRGLCAGALKALLPSGAATTIAGLALPSHHTLGRVVPITPRKGWLKRVPLPIMMPNPSRVYDYAEVTLEAGQKAWWVTEAPLATVAAVVAVVEEAGFAVKVVDVACYAFLRALDYVTQSVRLPSSVQGILVQEEALSQLWVCYRGVLLRAEVFSHDDSDVLVAQLKTAIESCLAVYPALTLDALWVMGGHAELTHAIQRELKVKVQCLEPWLTSDGSQPLHGWDKLSERKHWLIALGLALRGIA